METYICKTCQQPKPIDQFYSNSRSKDGIEHRCKPCETKRKNEWTKKNKEKLAKKARLWRQSNPEANKAIWQRNGKKLRDKLINFTREVRSKNPCLICQEHRVNCLEFHHVDPNAKEKAVASCKTMTSLLREIQRCIVLCSNCHSLFHAGDITLPEQLKPITLLSVV